MVDWWEEHGPPVYIAVAGYLGLIKKKKKSRSTSGTSSKSKGKGGDLNDLLKMFPGGNIN